MDKNRHKQSVTGRYRKKLKYMEKKRMATDRNVQQHTETERDGQKQTETERDGQKQTETVNNIKTWTGMYRINRNRQNRTKTD